LGTIFEKALPGAQERQLETRKSQTLRVIANSLGGSFWSPLFIGE
jgi:hypothetical protein